MDSDHSVIIAQMTLEEKVSLIIGGDTWHTAAVERLGVPAVTMADGPYGVRKEIAGEGLGVLDSDPSTCFPPPVALGCAFDEALTEQMGQAMGHEARDQGVDVLLAPAINVKRSPLCGRNFEYFSEDPLVAGRMGAAMIRGIQAAGVGTSLKHFAANNQETDRVRVSADVDARPLREIYLRGFEMAVKDAHPSTVMCSYNRINGVPSSRNEWLLTRVLRDEWGFDGVVLSDWGAVDDRVAALKAGLDLQMPSTDGYSNEQVATAVKDGSLDEALVDRAVERVLTLVGLVGARANPVSPSSIDDPPTNSANHVLARQIARRCVVLLKNEGGLLPLRREASVAVIGAFATQPRFQGFGSSQINPTRLDVSLDEIKSLATGPVTFAQGFSIDHSGDDKALYSEAVAVAAQADVVVVFLGLPGAAEAEGADRTSIDLPANQLALLDAIRQANQNVVVVLSNGGVVALPFRDDVPAIVEGWLLGQAGGGAIADVLYGVANPSGRLTQTIPHRIEDTPAFGNFPGEAGHVRYGEGLLVGYRWYDARDWGVAYPFGHGLTYTTFVYGAATATVNPEGDVIIAVPVTNTGDVAGREVVQAYTGLPTSSVQRPPRELKAFASAELQPGETKSCELLIKRADLAYWDVRVNPCEDVTQGGRWVVEGGEYTIDVGASSRDIRTSCQVEIKGDDIVLPLTMESTMAEALANPIVGPVLQPLIDLLIGVIDTANFTMMMSFPLSRLATMPGVPIDIDSVKDLVDMGNGKAS